MQILTCNEVVMFYGEIEKGIYSADPSRELYKIKNENGEFYAVTEGFDLFLVESLPEDYADDIYCYTKEKGFFLNPKHKEPAKTNEELEQMIAEEKQKNKELSETLDSLLTEILPTLMA